MKKLHDEDVIKELESLGIRYHVHNHDIQFRGKFKFYNGNFYIHQFASDGIDTGWFGSWDKTDIQDLSTLFVLYKEEFLK